MSEVYVTCAKCDRQIRAHRGRTICFPVCPRTAEARFWEKVAIRGPDECWLWTGHVNAKGYGTFSVEVEVGNPWKSILAHRFAWELGSNQKLPATERINTDQTIFVCHSCDRPPCVNFSHLFLGTNADNMRDSAMKLRKPRKLTIDDVRAIRREVEAAGGIRNTPYGVIAAIVRKYEKLRGVTDGAIEGVVYGTTWRHVK